MTIAPHVGARRALTIRGPCSMFAGCGVGSPARLADETVERHRPGRSVVLAQRPPRSPGASARRCAWRHPVPRQLPDEECLPHYLTKRVASIESLPPYGLALHVRAVW